MARTGYKTANNMLRTLGFWVTKKSFTTVSSPYAWLVLPTSVAGKEATFNDVVFSSDTLTDILKWAKEKMYPGTAMTTPETDPDTTEDGWTEPTTPEATKGADGTNVSLDAALRNILDGHKASLDSDEIRELIVAEVTKATEASQLGVKRVEITLPEGKTVTTEGEHDLFATLVQEMTLGHATLLAGSHRIQDRKQYASHSRLLGNKEVFHDRFQPLRLACAADKRSREGSYVQRRRIL